MTWDSWWPSERQQEAAEEHLLKVPCHLCGAKKGSPCVEDGEAAPAHGLRETLFVVTDGGRKKK